MEEVEKYIIKVLNIFFNINKIIVYLFKMS